MMYVAKVLPDSALKFACPEQACHVTQSIRMRLNESNWLWERQD